MKTWCYQSEERHTKHLLHLLLPHIFHGILEEAEPPVIDNQPHVARKSWRVKWTLSHRTRFRSSHWQLATNGEQKSKFLVYIIAVLSSDCYNFCIFALYISRISSNQLIGSFGLMLPIGHASAQRFRLPFQAESWRSLRDWSLAVRMRKPRSRAGRLTRRHSKPLLSAVVNVLNILNILSNLNNLNNNITPLLRCLVVSLLSLPAWSDLSKALVRCSWTWWLTFICGTRKIQRIRNKTAADY